jgi:CubicO group peptidase (beta-lactamase class C family)
MDARDYAKAELFAPLGISTSNWLRDPQLLAIGGFGLAMLPRDMAKIGYLYLRNGEWKDKRLLNRILRPGLAAALPNLRANDTPLKRTFDQIDTRVSEWINQTQLAA